ncbi:serine/threonine-protein kinase [Candida orthopsilosis Co 90-125]|uniref:Serine/threonine-protein kinase RIO1 n=1 Tax=Candida orthopsilosis (strain 90-125) TaxID=1136231 RepID=H8WW96_CANO9|nr:serine/threonine-protein kinase [Candida orthopsilosis Co 90-125]CCG20720.1 serine/threonine-protein kinase [Candida orthopsilosis Co 90-125]
MIADDISQKLEEFDLSDSDSNSDTEYEDETEYTRSNQASQFTVSKPLEKEDIVTKYADKIKTEPFKKGPQVTKDRAKRATVEQVLDARTLRFLGKIFRSGLITRINGCISTGKEANIYHGTHDDEESTEEFAVKIYKTSILVFKDRKRYVDGEFRFRNTKDQGNPRKMVKIWAEKEFRNLNRIYQSNVPCPKPYVIKSHVLVMEYLTEGDDQPSPKLKDYPFKGINDVNKYYHEMLICMRRLFQNCRLVHADLSEYNSIVHKDKLYIIDVSQSVEPDHPMALDFLRMDIKNVNDYFSRQNIDVYPEKSIFTFVTEPLGIEDSEEDLNAYLDSTPLKTTKDQEIEDEIFRSLHLVRSLKHLDERDFQKFSEGGVDTMRELVAPALPSEELTTATVDDNKEQDDNTSNSESDEESEKSDEDSSDDEEQAKPKGKKYEDKDEKKARKEATKLAKQEKRKTKMKKHVKKKLINKRKSGK